MFGAALAVDAATWGRGRGWVLSIGLIASTYFEHTNPVFAATARQMIAEVLADHEADPARPSKKGHAWASRGIIVLY